MYRSLIALSTAGILLCPLFAQPRATHAAGWVTTATQAEAPQLVGATSLGALPGSTTLRVSVALPMRNQTNLQQYIRSINTPGNPLYGQELSPSAFATTFGATSAQVQAVKTYLTQQGFSSVHAESNSLLITAKGTAAQAEAAFNTQIGLFVQNGKTIYANLSPAQVPAALSGDVAAVLGLTNAGTMVGVPVVPDPTGYIKAYNPADFQKVYDAGKTPAASKTAIAIFAEGDLTQTVKDLRAEEKANKMPQVPVTVVSTGVASTDTAGADEWDMDTQYSTGIAQTVSRLYIYDATTLTDSDLAISFSRFASQKVARAGSASFGECEYQAYLDGSMLADDMYFAEAAAQGQTVFASAGDTGGFCPVAPNNGVPAGVPLLNYPSSSPYVVSAGGTSLFSNSDGTYQDEIAWTAGGGGSSAFEYQPFWQSGITPATSTTCVQVVACLGKNTPDVAMDADPNSGANVYVNGSPLQVGGTSLASPLSLGVWARLETAHSNKIGFASIHLYNLYKAYPLPQTDAVPTSVTGFHDITLGNTGPYEATPGWDYATGLGSFDIAVMNKVIK